MGRMTGIRWEKSILCRPNHNIISSDFPKYIPQPWKFTVSIIKNKLILVYVNNLSSHMYIKQI